LLGDSRPNGGGRGTSLLSSSGSGGGGIKSEPRGKYEGARSSGNGKGTSSGGSELSMLSPLLLLKPRSSEKDNGEQKLALEIQNTPFDF